MPTIYGDDTTLCPHCGAWNDIDVNVRHCEKCGGGLGGGHGPGKEPPAPKEPRPASDVYVSQDGRTRVCPQCGELNDVVNLRCLRCAGAIRSGLTADELSVLRGTHPLPWRVAVDPFGRVEGLDFTNVCILAANNKVVALIPGRPDFYQARLVLANLIVSEVNKESNP